MYALQGNTRCRQTLLCHILYYHSVIWGIDIGGLLSQTATICLFVFKLFPSSKEYETLWAYQTQCMYSCGWITPTKICVRTVIWCLSHQWSREGKLWKPVTRKLLNGIEIWFHIRVELFEICMWSTLWHAVGQGVLWRCLQLAPYPLTPRILGRKGAKVGLHESDPWALDPHGN